MYTFFYSDHCMTSTLLIFQVKVQRVGQTGS